MSKRALASAIVLAGLMLVLAAAVVAFVLAAAVVSGVAAWLLFGGLAAGVAVTLVGALAIDVEPRT